MIFYNISYIIYYYERISKPVISLSSESTLKNKAANPFADVEVFGHYQAKSKLEFMPLSQLNLSLVSIMFSKGAPEESFVLIRSDDQLSKVYKKGDEILPGILLDKVLKDAVIVDNNHQLEMIKLPQESKLQGITPVEIQHAN